MRNIGEQVRCAKHIKGVPPTTFAIIIRWFLIQIAYNTGNVVKTDKVVRTKNNNNNNNGSTIN